MRNKELKIRLGQLQEEISKASLPGLKNVLSASFLNIHITFDETSL